MFLTRWKRTLRHNSAVRNVMRSLTIHEAVANNELNVIDTDHIRNFSIIAHVDHGKSTLADCLLQITGNISDNQRQKGQVLDNLKVERDRGITVKAVTASMIFDDERTGERYLVNLIDTPGHIDFSYEVARSLSSCQGALLLVDSTQSVQAQTLANYAKAKAIGLNIIPVVTKIDLPSAQPEDTALLMGTTFGIEPDKAIMTSAKLKEGILEVLQSVVDDLPPPTVLDEEKGKEFKGRIVDSWFDEHRGVICLVQVISGSIREGQRITNFASVKEAKDLDSRSDFSVQEVGLMTPQQLRTKELKMGQVGYIVCGMRSTRQARIGDTMYIPNEWSSADAVVPLTGYEAAKPMLFASVFPANPSDLESLYSAIDRLCLNDSSLLVTKDQSSSLGSGLRCGFLGFLHMDVFNQRLFDEYNMEVVVTTPSVPYIIEQADGKKVEVSSVSNWPTCHERDFRVFEPMVQVVLITPTAYYGPMLEILKDRRATGIDIQYLDDGQVVITSILPWQEVVCDMNDQVKHLSAGYASFNYESRDYEEAELLKVEVAINGEACDPLSFIAHKDKAQAHGRKLCLKLKETLDRQMFDIIIQARVGTKVLARERIAPFRKDVLVKSGKMVGGGDVSRKKKLLEKQKEGKKRARMVGKVEVSQEAFWTVLQR